MSNRLAPNDMEKDIEESEPLLGRFSILTKCDHRVLISGVVLCNSSLYAYIPLLPEAQEEYHTTAFWITVSFVLNWAGRGLSGRAIWVPLSDCSVGRRYSLVLGMTVFVLGTSLAGMATSATMRLLGRLIQGIGAGSSRSLAEMIFYDVYGDDNTIMNADDRSPITANRKNNNFNQERNDAIASLGQVYVSVITIAPAIAGSLVWVGEAAGVEDRTVSYFLIAWAIVQLFLYLLFVPETRRGVPTLSIRESFGATYRAASVAIHEVGQNTKNNPLLLSGLLWNACTSGVYGAILTLFPFTLSRRFGLSTPYTGVLVGTLGIAYFFGLVLARLVQAMTVVIDQQRQINTTSFFFLRRGAIINLRIAMGFYTLVALTFAAITICYAFHIAPQFLHFHHGFSTLWFLLIALYAHECVWAFANLSVMASMLSVCESPHAQASIVATNNVLMVLGFVFSGLFSSGVAGFYNTYARPDVLYGIIAGWSVIGSIVYWLSLTRRGVRSSHLPDPSDTSVAVAETEDRL